jgi:hypothetical protein
MDPQARDENNRGRAPFYAAAAEMRIQAIVNSKKRHRSMTRSGQFLIKFV